MNPQDQQFWIAFALFGLPLIVMFGGPAARGMLVLLGGLALLAWSPMLAAVLLVLYLLIGPLRIIGEAILIGLAGGTSARITGVFNSPERAERQRERWLDRRDRGQRISKD
jgi:hypothetical protein